MVNDNDTIIIHFDGACEPYNPGGRMGFGVNITTGDGRVLHSISEQTGFSSDNSNNVAEYYSLVLGLQWVVDNDLQGKTVKVYGDSALVINQMNGTWRARGGRYYDYYLRAVELQKLFPDITFTWVRREFNTIADNLSKNF